MVSKAKFFGSCLIITGSALGAGMLALPMVSAQAGFLASVVLLLSLWIVMVVSGLLLLEVNLAFEVYRNSFGTMSAKILGPVARNITWVSFLLLLYATTAAYIDGAASLIGSLLQDAFNITIPAWVNAIAFTLVFGGTVYWSTKAVDFLIRGLMGIKGILLIFTLTLLMPHINFVQLCVHPKYYHLLLAAPIFLNSFGYHFVVPSITNYIGKEHPKALQWIIIVGATIPLIIYLIWLTTSLGILPLTGKDSFATVAREHESVGVFIQSIAHIINNKWVTYSINSFANVAIITSFLGVCLSVFDFLADGFKRPNTRWGRTQTAVLTFTPPIIFALFYPDGFVWALSYSAIFAAVLELILPALMVYRFRQRSDLTSNYRVSCGTPLLLFVFVIGLMFLVIPFAQLTK